MQEDRDSNHSSQMFEATALTINSQPLPSERVFVWHKNAI